MNMLNYMRTACKEEYILVLGSIRTVVDLAKKYDLKLDRWNHFES